MESFQPIVRVLALLALLMTSFVLYAQEATEEPAPEAMPIVEVAGSGVTIVGSGIVNPMLQILTESSGSINDYSFTNTGAVSGFEEFCAGRADVTTSIRTINTAEDTACRETSVEYIELLIGYDIMAFVANPEDDFLACLTLENLNSVFAPSSAGQVTNWEQVGLAALAPELATSEAEATPEVTPEPEVIPDIAVLIPTDNTLTYATLDNFVAGIGIRDDAIVADYQVILDTVTTTRGAIGVVPLEVALAVGSELSILEVDFPGDALGCESPAVTTVEGARYYAATPLYLYVNINAQETLAFFLDYLTSSVNMDAIVSTGFSPASARIFEINRAVLSGEVSGRAFSAEEVTFEIPQGMIDEINIGGAPSGFRFSESNSTRLTSTQETLTVNTSFNGQTAGIEAFCNSILDVLFVNGDGTNVCGETDINYLNYPLGHQGIVLVANAGDSYAACLTLEQITTIWGAASTDTVTQWNHVAESFPEQDITLFGIREGNFVTDILLTPADGGGVTQPVRLDVAETNGDPMYRAAATANVSGALSYMSWQNYARVLENGQENIQLVAVNAGDGCVVPSVETITNQTYPLTRQTTMLVKELSMARTAVQAYVWTMFMDESYGLFAASYFIGIEQENLAQMRTDLLVQFEQSNEAARLAAEARAAEATPEATEEAGD